jgi:HTH-type transcriptional regulator / antitoxin HipB
MLVVQMHDRSFPEMLAAAVRRRRRELRLHQIELAELAECSTRFVHTIEAGKPTVRLDKLLAVLQVLGLRLQVVQGRSSTTPREGP